MRKLFLLKDFKEFFETPFLNNKLALYYASNLRNNDKMKKTTPAAIRKLEMIHKNSDTQI